MPKLNTPKRNSAPKVRTGCVTCKARHVKCNEKKPRCSPCEKSSRQCEYSTEPVKQYSQQLKFVYWQQPECCTSSSNAPPTSNQAAVGPALPSHGHWLVRSDCPGATGSKQQSVCSARGDTSDGSASTYATNDSMRSSASARSWLLKADIIQLPISCIPIENTESVTVAFEFFKHVWIPVKQKSLSSSASTLFKDRMQVVLQDPMLFDQMIAYCLLLLNIDKCPRHRMTSSILYHSNRSLAQLRQRLQSSCSGDRLSGAVFQTVLLLAVLHYTCADFKPLSVHLQALHQLINLSDGQHRVEWNRFVRGQLRQLDISWDVTRVSQTAQVREKISPTYPNHPFNSTICHLITNFRPGFRELALRRRLSLDFMHVLEGSPDAAFEQDPWEALWPAFNVIDDLITNPELSVLERVLAIALLSCSLSAARAQGPTSSIAELSIHVHARSFPARRTISDGDFLEEEALDWAALALQYNTEEPCLAWAWANKRICRTAEALRREEYEWNLQKRFLFVPGWNLV